MTDKKWFKIRIEENNSLKNNTNNDLRKIIHLSSLNVLVIKS